MSYVEGGTTSMSDLSYAQRKAVLHTGSDILISAGAGSGKTRTLTTRIIKKLLEDEEDITKKLIVTFTKEAANKLKSDITDAIVTALHTCSEDKKEFLRKQIVNTSIADISTIHSFCLNVIKPNFNKLPLDSDFRIGEENEIDYIKKEVMKEVIEELYEMKTPSEDFLIICDCYSQISKNDALDNKLLTLYEKLSSTPKFLDTLLITQDSYVDFMQTVYGEIIINEISMLINHFRPIYEKIRDEVLLKDGTPKFLDAITGDLAQIEELEKATQDATYLGIKRVFVDYNPNDLTQDINKSAIENIAFVKEIRKDFKKRHQKLKDDFFSYAKPTLDLVFKYNNRICKAIYNILVVFEKRYKERKRKYGICDFNDLERYTHQLLVEPNGKPTPLAKEISLKYDEIYIDEYQDTNALQDEIFASISRNNRFMVGDIKQSIYRFRSAEPEIFSSYRNSFEDVTDTEDKGENGKTIFMSDNFRCDESVIKTSNDVSNYMFFNSFGIPYSMKDNLIKSKFYDEKNPYNPRNTEVCLLDFSTFEEEDNEKLKEQKNILQAKYVAQRIAEIIKAHTYDNGKLNIKLSDIAILIRKGKYKKYYINALSKLGIDTEYVDDVKFFEKPHVLLLLSILNTIDNPYKDTYLAGALCSPVFNFTADDLLKIRKASKGGLPLYTALQSYEGEEEIIEKIEKFQKKLLLMQNEIKKLNSFDAISFVMSACGLTNSSRSEKRDLIKLYNHAREYESSSYKGLYKFLNYIEGIKDSRSKEAVFTNPNDYVRIMTIHASKGLEFEYCFLCNAEGEFYFNEKMDDLLFDKRLGIIGYVGNTGSLVKYKTILRKIATTAIDRAGKEEEMRILYVAMTRAKGKLIVTASVDNLNEYKATTSTFAPYSSPLYVYSLKSYLDYIYNALYLPRDYVDFPIIDMDNLINSSTTQKSEEKELNSDLIKQMQETLKRRFDFEYKYDYLRKIPSKLSVSKLKENILDKNENDEIDLTKELKRKPKFLGVEEEEATGADKGTATHVFMQFCNFKNLEENGFDDELKNLKDEAFISEADAELINKEHIENFVSSKLFNDMKKAKLFKREFRFNAMVDATEFTEDPDLKKQKVLVQGVVDAVFIDENDKLVLVDYKTDKVNKYNYVQVLTERYTRQLSYYKQAMEAIFERKVDKVCLYSVPMAKEVELKF